MTLRSAVGPMQAETPRDLDAALRFLAEHAGESWIPVAGGTDLLVAINNGSSPGDRWLNLWPLRNALNGVRDTGDGWSVGAMTTMTELRRAAAEHEDFPAVVAEAAAVVGGLQIQNRATVAGNVVNASPAGDTLPVWAVLDAEVVLASVRGTRAVPFPEFYLGYRKLDREPDELVTGLRFSKPAPGGAWFFHKVGTRAAQAISKAVLAGRVRVAKDGTFEEVRLAAGSLAPTPVRLRTVEAALAGEPAGEESVGRALDLLDRDITPIDDIRSTRDYRMSVTRNLLAHHLLAAVRPL